MLFADTIGGGGGGVLNTNGRGESRLDGGVVCDSDLTGPDSKGGDSWRDEVTDAGTTTGGTFGLRKIGGTICSEGDRMFSATVFSTIAFISSSDSFGFLEPDRVAPPAVSFAFRFTCVVLPLDVVVVLVADAVLAAVGETLDVGDFFNEDTFSTCEGEVLFFVGEDCSVLIGVSSNEFRNCDFSSSNLRFGGGGVGGDGGNGGGDGVMLLSVFLGMPNFKVDVAMSGLR